MNINDKILEILENSEHSVSGASLARLLGLSRNSVWKSINVLRAEGYKINATTNRGYLLSENNQIVSVAGIKKYLNEDTNITVLKSVSSTNTVAKKAAEENASEGCIIIAEKQTAGKGRLGRQFYSPSDSGLYMSIILRPELPLCETSMITTAAAVAVSNAIDELCDTLTSIKWVNDIFIGGKKICGILTESAVNLESDKTYYAILGIGVNVCQPAKGFPEDISDTAGSIFNTCNATIKCKLAAAIINNFFEIYRKLPKKGFMDTYRKKSNILGKTVHFLKNGEETSALAINIDDNAHLVVRFENGATEHIGAGEVSVKL